MKTAAQQISYERNSQAQRFDLSANLFRMWRATVMIRRMALSVIEKEPFSFTTRADDAFLQ